MAELRRLIVTAVHAVRRPANRRPFLLVRQAAEPEPTLARKTGEDLGPAPTVFGGLTLAAMVGMGFRTTAKEVATMAADESAWDVAERRARLLVASADAKTLEDGIRKAFDDDPDLYARYQAESYSEPYARKLMKPASAPASPKVASAVRLQQPYWEGIEALADWDVRKGNAPDKATALQQLFDECPGLYELYRRESMG